MMPLPDGDPQEAGGAHLRGIEVTRNRSELFRAECARLILDADKACKGMRADGGKRLDQRVRDIRFLRKELELKLEEILTETDSLLVLQSRVSKALEACKEPLRVTVLCLEERTKRPESERMRHCEVDRELLKEMGLIQEVPSLLQRVVEQITEQIRLNRSVKYQLEHDLREKFEAQCIDNSCALMTSHSPNNQQTPRSDSIILPSLEVTPKQWEYISDINISQAEKHKMNSQSLRTLVDSLLAQTAADMQKQVQATTSALELNVKEIKKAKSQMEDELSKILSEFAGQQKTREDLQVAIAENELSLSLAQARLALRRKRPAKEQCHDPAQSQLLAEVQQLNAHIHKLHEAAAESEVEQRALLRCQLELQENIGKKASCLYIDEVVCTKHRAPILIHNF